MSWIVIWRTGHNGQGNLFIQEDDIEHPEEFKTSGAAERAAEEMDCSKIWPYVVVEAP